MVDEFNVLCTCRECGQKFPVARLDIVAVHLGDYPVICDRCKYQKKAFENFKVRYG